MRLPVFFDALVKMVFPPKCIFCGTLLDIRSSEDICPCCFKSIPFIYNSIAYDCEKSGIDSACDSVICICGYSGIVRKALMGFKFYGKPGYCRAFAGLLCERIKKMTDYREFDIILSVPLHKRKKAVRGYNQSLLLSRELSRRLGIPEKSRLISRIRDTDSQSLLGRNERRLNVMNAFEVKEASEVAGRNILLVDDIITTGNTLHECGRVLKDAGAKKVVGAVIATGRGGL